MPACGRSAAAIGRCPVNCASSPACRAGRRARAEADPGVEHRRADRRVGVAGVGVIDEADVAAGHRHVVGEQSSGPGTSGASTAWRMTSGAVRRAGRCRRRRPVALADLGAEVVKVRPFETVSRSTSSGRRGVGHPREHHRRPHRPAAATTRAGPRPSPGRASGCPRPPAAASRRGPRCGTGRHRRAARRGCRRGGRRRPSSGSGSPPGRGHRRRRSRRPARSRPARDRR